MTETWLFWRAVIRHPWVTDLTETTHEELVSAPLPRAGAFVGAPDAHRHEGFRVTISFRYYSKPGERQEIYRIVPLAVIESAIADPIEVARDSLRRDVIDWIDRHTAGGLKANGARWSEREKG